jgi:hypothetical protein
MTNIFCGQLPTVKAKIGILAVHSRHWTSVTYFVDTVLYQLYMKYKDTSVLTIYSPSDIFRKQSTTVPNEITHQLGPVVKMVMR